MAERKPAPPVAAPPPVVGLSVSVHRGETVDIPLRIYGIRNQTLDFRIRAQPQTGKLSLITRTGQESASVSFTPPADVAIKRDRFSYAVRSREGVSAAADVWINIVDRAPILVTPESLEFPRSIIGAKTVQEFEIANRGGGIAEGELEMDEPWSIEGERRYRLGAGDRRTFKMIFTPVIECTFSGELRYSSHPDRATALRGIARPPIALAPATLGLQHDANSAVRAGAFEAINNTAQDQTLKFSASDRLTFERAQTIPAGRAQSVIVQMSANDLSALSDEIRAEANGYSAFLRVTASPVRPILHVHPPRVRFDNAIANVPARAALGIENGGGTAVTVALSVASPFALEHPRVRIETGETARASIVLLSSPEGAYRGTLTLRSEAGELDVPIEATVAPNAKPAVPATPDRGARSRPESPTRLVNAELPLNDSAIAPERPRVQQTTPTTATIEWPANLSPAKRFKAQERRLALQGRELKIEWVEHSGFSTEARGDRILATFTGLAPGVPYMMRVVPVISLDEQTDPLLEVQLRTPTEPPHGFKITWLRVLVGLLLICAGVAIWQRTRRVNQFNT